MAYATRAHFGLPSQSSSFLWPRRRQEIPSCGIAGIRHRASAGGSPVRGSPVRNRERKSGIRREWRFRIQRLRCTLTRRLFPSLLLRRGSSADLLFSDDHYGRNRPARSIGLCAYCDRTGIDATPAA
jgi:hypothetical protein